MIIIAQLFIILLSISRKNVILMLYKKSKTFNYNFWLSSQKNKNVKSFLQTGYQLPTTY